MALDTNVIKTPQEYIDYYANEMKADLNDYNIQTNRLGFIGYFFNILGETQYDSKRYYEYLFKEGFVATAEEDFNLYMHAFIHGFNPNMATPSKAVGTVSLDFSFLNKRRSNVVKREILVSNISFNVNDYKFTTENSYRFVEEIDSYYCVIENLKTAKRKYIPSTDNVVTVNLEEFYQYEQRETLVQVQDYKFGTFYQEPINLEDGKYLSTIKGYVRRSNKTYNESDDNDWDQFDIKIDKYLANGYEDSLFLRIMGSNSYIIECGSGTRGAWIPYAMLKLNQNITNGFAGNLNTEFHTKFNPQTVVSVREFLSDNTVRDELYLNVKDLIQVNFKYSEEGLNPPQNEELRLSILKWIQSRENLINYKDYYNLANNKYTKDFKFIFRKSSMLDNIFYLHRLFRDKYFNPVQSFNKTTMNLERWDIPGDTYVWPTIENINATKLYDDEYNLETGSYEYKVYAHNYFSSSEQTADSFIIVDIDNDANENGVELTWNPIDDVEGYRIYKQFVDSNNEIYYEYFDVYDTTFIDDGNKQGKYSKILFNNDLVIRPTFMDSNIEYISPFVYIYNKNMNWYNGYILYDNKIEYLTDTQQYFTDAGLPIFYFNIKYDDERKQSYIDVKSNQEISDEYEFIIDIQQLNVNQETLVRVDDHTHRYVFIDGETDGLIMKTFTARIYVYKNGSLLLEGKTGLIDQIYDITDNLKLIKYRTISKSNLILNIPVINKEVYDSDPEYYLEKVRIYLRVNDIENNRMVSDEVQFRFMNSAYIPQIYLACVLLHKEYTEDIVFPLKLKIRIFVDDLYISTNNINLETEKDQIYEFISRLLQNNYSGEYISYYNSHIIDVIHTARPYVKTVKVNVTDYNGIPLDEGLDMVSDDDQILDNIQALADDVTDYKSLLITYNPPYWHWDLENLDIRFQIQENK